MWARAQTLPSSSSLALRRLKGLVPRLQFNQVALRKWRNTRVETAVQVYCDTQRVCGCSNTTGWTRVASLNTSDPSQQCPGDWVLQTYSSEPRRLCGRGSSGAGCLSAVYSTYGISYNHVCGRVIGYAYTSPDAFPGSHTIEGPYVDGVSLTHGPPGARQHVWTFAAGLLETVHATYSTASCPCVGGTAAPTFVGNDYFCESGNPGPSFTNILYASDPLWDGQGCGSPPCCELTSPPGVIAPWFCKQLPQATTDEDIQLNLSNSTSAEVYLLNYAAVWTQTVSYFLLTRLSSLDPARNVD